MIYFFCFEKKANVLMSPVMGYLFQLFVLTFGVVPGGHLYFSCTIKCSKKCEVEVSPIINTVLLSENLTKVFIIILCVFWTLCLALTVTDGISKFYFLFCTKKIVVFVVLLMYQTKRFK